MSEQNGQPKAAIVLADVTDESVETFEAPADAEYRHPDSLESAPREEWPEPPY